MAHFSDQEFGRRPELFFCASQNFKFWLLQDNADAKSYPQVIHMASCPKNPCNTCYKSEPTFLYAQQKADSA